MWMVIGRSLRPRPRQALHDHRDACFRCLPRSFPFLSHFRTPVGDRWDQRPSVWSFVVLVVSPVLRNTPQMHRSQRQSDSIFGVTRLLAESIGKPHPEYAWLIHRLTQIEVASLVYIT